MSLLNEYKLNLFCFVDLVRGKWVEEGGWKGLSGPNPSINPWASLTWITLLNCLSSWTGYDWFLYWLDLFTNWVWLKNSSKIVSMGSRYDYSTCSTLGPGWSGWALRCHAHLRTQDRHPPLPSRHGGKLDSGLERWSGERWGSARLGLCCRGESDGHLHARPPGSRPDQQSGQHHRHSVLARIQVQGTFNNFKDWT